MTAQLAFFYFFSSFLITASLGVIFSRNTVHSVLCLILCFFNAGALFLLLSAEMIAFILLIVYIGAVAVLFLFVVMMLEDGIRSTTSKPFYKGGLFISFILGIEVMGAVLIGWFSAAPQDIGLPNAPASHNVKALGKVLYTDYFYPFQLGGIVLLVAMIGAIVLTHRITRNIKRQNISKQINQTSDSLKMIDVPFKKGLSIKE